jgi:hypothetical protein
VKNNTKKIENNTKKFEFKSKIRIKSFEKNPKKGGTPAIEKKERSKNLVKMFVDPRLEKE